MVPYRVLRHAVHAARVVLLRKRHREVSNYAYEAYIEGDIGKSFDLFEAVRDIHYLKERRKVPENMPAPVYLMSVMIHAIGKAYSYAGTERLPIGTRVKVPVMGNVRSGTVIDYGANCAGPVKFILSVVDELDEEMTKISADIDKTRAELQQLDTKRRDVSAQLSSQLNARSALRRRIEQRGSDAKYMGRMFNV